ncbi:hypothetical protein BM613_11915 [Sulfoacidibacillus thermotolerans]|uniref:Glutamate synthase domain-containing protein n=2 Tax=Sulfoacidibacillus thermotolerans TaxID=1765684 RepID=A0A2U3D693_SULT2|nr:hypothetical protein BM613_11915 [Sulfoacidibacillus thermotolerans]
MYDTFWGIPSWLWLIVLLVVLGGTLASLLFPLWLRRFLNQQIDQTVTRLFTEAYTKNLLEGVNAVRKVGIQTTVENELRAHTPEPLSKPIGTHRNFPDFDGLLFSPVQLSVQPLDHTVPISLETKIGKHAEKPMILSMPMMVTAMGYGVSISKPFIHAIAKGTALANTAMNAGQGPVLSELREYARHMIVQYHGAPWRPSEEALRAADMIEIRYGQGANVGCGTVVPKKTLTREIMSDMGFSPDEPLQDLYIPVGIPGIHSLADLKQLVHYLRKAGRGVPIALKMAAGLDLERNIEMAVKAGVDVIVIDGAQGGTHSSPAILVDDFGLPTLSALCRAEQFLCQKDLRDQVDLVISGGIRTPGDILKALALGADGVYMGTAALFAATHTQITKALPFEPPTQLAFADGSLFEQYDVEKGAQSLANYLRSCSEEMKVGVRAVGKKSVHDVSKSDLMAWDAEAARVAGVPLI